MANSEVMSTYIKKLSHPLKEIRERSLQLLVAKLQLGWQLEDELTGTRDLLDALLSWFHIEQPALQKEALHLLLSTIKTKAGTYIAREIGIKKIICTLDKLKNKIEIDAMEIYYDVLDTLRFLNTVESEAELGIPPLTLSSLAGFRSESGDDGISSCYNLGYNLPSSKETSVSDEPLQSSRPQDFRAEKMDGIKVFLFPWVELCSSDSKTLILVEDALKLLKSTHRCCRFICDVFIQDFPAEIFLNRPCIIKSLQSIADGRHGKCPGDALHVLLCVTRAQRVRIQQLSCWDLLHEGGKLLEDSQETTEDFHQELQQLAGDGGSETSGEEDKLAALKQLPAPIFALDTLQIVLAIMARNVALVDPVNKNEVLDLKETNTCLNLINHLIELLLECVRESFWRMEHNSKAYRDIAHKSCMAMRLLGDILNKYKKSFYDDTSRTHYRVIWLRLVWSAEKLLSWARYSALPPSSIVTALQVAQLDPALDILYPDMSKRVANVIQHSRISIDQEHKSKYRELKKIYRSMQEAAQFMLNKNSCRNTKGVLQCIKKSLPVLELHLSEGYMSDISEILLRKTKDFELDEKDWSDARSIALNLMAHNIEWVQAKFYRMLVEMVRGVLVGDEVTQTENEICLNLLCDVGILTEICCHGMSSKYKEVESCASDVMLYLLRGRLVLSEACWWRLLASLLPVMPLLHAYANHETQLGQAICKSLESDIAECMGVCGAEVCAGLVRLLFVRCPPARYQAARALARRLDDEKYLPPRESLREDIIVSALDRLEPQDFNIDDNSSTTKSPSTTGLMQILDVLKQDIVLDEHGVDFVARSDVTPILDPSLRRSTLQQLSVIMRQPDLHDTFVQCDGVRVVVAILRMSMIVDDYLAFPECAISCVSVLNSVCFASRHTLAKIPDLPLLLLRVILVFPSNDNAVQVSAQILAMVAWSGFALQELNQSRHRVPALPLSVTERTKLPFVVNSYWNISPNAEHSSIEWLLSDEDVRAAIRMQWWVACEGGPRVLRGAPPPPAPLAFRPTARDLAALRAACPAYSCTKALMDLENATSHRQVFQALGLLESYMYLLPQSSVASKEFGALPWQHTRRFLCAPPASSRDTALLINLLRFILAYMDNVANDEEAMTWIRNYFIGSDASVISLLSREELYLEQTPQESIEVSQLHTHIVKVLHKCVIKLEEHNDFDSSKMETLMKILLACLQKIDLRNFHMLGYLNELVRCIRYALNCRYCKLSEEALVQCMRVTTATLAGSAAGGGRKGQACRLDALLALLAMLRQVHTDHIPPQRWSDAWTGEAVRAVVKSSSGARPELRAAALHVIAALAHYAQLLPHLLQAISMESVSQFAASIFADGTEANVVRSGAASVITALASRASPYTDVLENDVLRQLREYNFLGNCLDILVDFCNDKSYSFSLEPNVPYALLARRAELEVRDQKCGDVVVSPSMAFRGRPPPTPCLIASIADCIHNVSNFRHCPLQQWNDKGLFRLLFRCASWSKGSPADVVGVRVSTCRALSAAALMQRRVQATLATTKDCLLGFLNTLTPVDEDNKDSDIITSKAQGLNLLATLLTERVADDTVWTALKDTPSSALFCTLLQSLESDEIELQDAALYCLTQLAQTANRKLSDKSIDDSPIRFFDDVKSPYITSLSERMRAGDGSDCQPEFMIEELFKVLIDLYQKLMADAKIFNNQDDRLHRVGSCLSSLLSASPRCRSYGVHRHTPKVLLSSLQTIRDGLSLQGSPDAIRSASQNPNICNLQWLLTLIECHMIDCAAAKESFAENGIAVSLVRLWPWCMLTPELREGLVHLLFNFTNDCEKAWGAMSSCIGGRNLVAEICGLVSKEASLQHSKRSDNLLLLGMRTLRHTVPHHHCRAIILKSEACTSVYKLRVKERTMSAAGEEWARLCEALSRHADGAGALLALRPLHTAAAVRARLMPALAHVARHRRSAVLQAPDLLELISGTLLAGDTAEIVSAARAVWALAANNHKAKLLLRSAGIVAAMHSALQRMQRIPSTPETQRALQLLIYTNSILRTS